MRSTNRQRIRLLFGMAFVLLVVQFGVGRTVKEFYPGWVLPGFAGVASPGEYVRDEELTLRLHFRDGSSAEIGSREFLPDMVHRRRRAVVWNLFPKAPDDEGSERGTDSLWPRIAAWAGPPPSAAASPELREWLGEYFRRRFDRRPRELVARWKEKTYVRTTRELKESKLLSETTIDFQSNDATVRRPTRNG